MKEIIKKYVYGFSNSVILYFEYLLLNAISNRTNIPNTNVFIEICSFQHIYTYIINNIINSINNIINSINIYYTFIINSMSKEENTLLMNLYFKLYVGCIEYKASKKINNKNKINCDKYYDNYEKYLSKLNKNNTIFK